MVTVDGRRYRLSGAGRSPHRRGWQSELSGGSRARRRSWVAGWPAESSRSATPKPHPSQGSRSACRPPLPTDRSVRAAQEILTCVGDAGPDDLVLTLLHRWELGAVEPSTGGRIDFRQTRAARAVAVERAGDHRRQRRSQTRVSDQGWTRRRGGTAGASRQPDGL